MNKEEFEAKLNKVYNGSVKPLTRYINERCFMYFYCDKCGVEFYNKASYMVGKDHQIHKCGLPYGTSYGDRLSSVSHVNPPKNKSSKDIEKRLYELIIQDYTYQEIAKELRLNPALVKDHFLALGLIE